MRLLGFLLIAVGVIGTLFALNMDVSVSAGFGLGSVNNIGLMDDRRNYLILSGMVVIVGVLLALFAPQRAAANPYADPYADPFENEDRARLAERQRLAVSLGVTRIDGIYHYHGEPCAGLEEAITRARPTRDTVGPTAEDRARRAEMDREANRYLDRLMIIGFVIIVVGAASALLFMR
jgi:hypothetical protein